MRLTPNVPIDRVARRAARFLQVPEGFPARVRKGSRRKDLTANRFAEWDPRTLELGIYYLLSLSSRYQVQIMYSRLRISQNP